MKERNSNIELLRIIAMCMIIGIHYWNAQIANSKFLNNSVFYVMQPLCVCGVNLFVLITGWFSVKSSVIDLKKIFRLLLDVSIWGVIGWLFACVLFDEDVSLHSFLQAAIPHFRRNRWFVEAYVILLLFIPFINICLHKISQISHRILMYICITLFVVWPSFLPYPPVDDYGFGFIHFISLYIIISYVRMHVNKLPSKLMCWAGFVISYCMIQLEQQLNIAQRWHYDSLFVVTEALFLFLFFVQLNFKSKWINLLAANSFGVYLIHTEPLFFQKVCFYNMFAEYNTNGFLAQTAIFVISLSGIYLVCSVLEEFKKEVCRYSFDKVIDKIPFLKKINID